MVLVRDHDLNSPTMGILQVRLDAVGNFLVRREMDGHLSLLCNVFVGHGLLSEHWIRRLPDFTRQKFPRIQGLSLFRNVMTYQ
jgi:hypothetical protein